jgi:hypothetical protein
MKNALPHLLIGNHNFFIAASYPEPKFKVILWELKPALAWGYWYIPAI